MKYVIAIILGIGLYIVGYDLYLYAIENAPRIDPEKKSIGRVTDISLLTIKNILILLGTLSALYGIMGMLFKSPVKTVLIFILIQGFAIGILYSFYDISVSCRSDDYGNLIAFSQNIFQKNITYRVGGAICFGNGLTHKNPIINYLVPLLKISLLVFIFRLTIVIKGKLKEKKE